MTFKFHGIPVQAYDDPPNMCGMGRRAVHPCVFHRRTEGCTFHKNNPEPSSFSTCTGIVYWSQEAQNIVDMIDRMERSDAA